MTAHRITYEGPSSLAVQTATLIADAHGVVLTAAGQPDHRDEAADTVVLRLTVEGSPEDVTSAVSRIRADLPGDARLTVEEERTGGP